MLSPKEVVKKWVDAFNAGDVDMIVSLYDNNATNHQVINEPVVGVVAIREMFANEFSTAKMVCIVENIFEDDVPYDLDAPVIEIPREDYGIWYVDMMDNLDKYVDKTVRFKGQVLKSRELNAGFFVPGRMAMTCCADDTQFIGYICKNPAAKRLRIGSWVTVTAKVKDEFMEVYNGRGPVLYATEIEAAEKPEQELVYFG